MKGVLRSCFFPVIIFLGSIGVCLLYGWKVRQALADDIYILTAQDAGRSFHTADLLRVQKKGIDAAFEQPTVAEVSNGFRKEDISVSAVNENYAYFTNMQVLKGAFFNGVQVSRKYCLAVINEAAAHQLFGNEDCLGQVIYLNHIPYEVTGIVREQGEEAETKIYIPYTVLEDMGAELSVRQLWCRFENLAEAALVLDQMGYSLKAVGIVQTNDLKGIFMQRFWILVILLDLCCVSYLFSGFKRYKMWSKNKLIPTFGLLLGSVIGISAAFIATKLAIYVPPVHELSGKSWRSVLYRLIDFYLLADIDIGNLAFLHYWNVFSLLSFVVCLISGVTVYVADLRNNAIKRSWS